MEKKPLTYQVASARIALIAINAILIAALVVAFVAYSSLYREELRNRSISEVESLTSSSAGILSTAFDEMGQRVAEKAHFIDARKLNVGDSLSYLADASANEDVQMQLVALGGIGWAATRTDDGFLPVDYSSYGYANVANVFQKAEGEDYGAILYAPEFTNHADGFKVIAAYTYLQIRDNRGVLDDYVLMCTVRESLIEDRLSVSSDIEDFTLAVIDENGGYLLSSPTFKSVDFFQFLYVYNNLSLEQKNGVGDLMRSSQSGVLEYNDAQGVPCLFAYSQLQGRDWFAVSRVPESSLRTGGFDLRFALVAILFAVALVAVNSLAFSRMNNRLKLSVQREREASIAKTDFLSRMSHDIRTPLNVIVGMTELARGQKNPPETDECLDNVDSASRFLLGLVNDILDLNKVEAGMMELAHEPYRASDFKRYLDGVMRPLCEAKGIAFSVSMNLGAGWSEDVAIATDPLRVNQIFFNLLSNAVKFTPQGGHVSFDMDMEPLGENRCRIVASVKDDGCGMSEEFQKHMFESFVQERNDVGNTQGSGLGLAIVSSLVTLMGGKLDVESALGQGTRFTVTVEAELAAVEADEADEVVDLAVLRGAHVLLVEDYPLNRRIVVQLLARYGVEVDQAEDGQQGVTAFSASEQGFYDAVLMDMRMPVMDGLEATRAIRALDRADAATVPIIAMTANAYVQDVDDCLAAGMNAHLSKPVEPDRLFQTLAGFVHDYRQQG